MNPSETRWIALIVALYLCHLSIFGNYIADDAGISLAYARNIVQGYGPVLYPGAEAVEGFSNPLWTLLIALGVVLRWDVANGVPLLKTLGAVSGAAVILLTARAGRAAYPDDDRVRWLAPLLLATWTPFVFWSGAGLENPLYALLLLAAATLQWQELRGRGRAPWSAAALFGVAATRPEGVAFFLAFLVHRVWVNSARSALVRWALTFALPFAALLGIRYVVFGDWVPNTFYAKVLDRELLHIPAYLTTTEDPGFAYLQTFVYASWPVLLVAAIGLLDLRQWRTSLLIVAVGGGMAAYALYVGGDWWPQWRFLSAVLPFLALAAQHGVQVVGVRRPRSGLVIAMALVVGVLTPSVWTSFDLRRRHAEDGLVGLHGRLAQAQRIRDLAARYGIQDPLYVDPDIGGPSVAGLRVLDLAGLADIHIARFHYYPDFFRHYIFVERRPEIIRTHDNWTRSSRITEFPEFHEQYVAISASRDARGLHGEFVRRDLVDGEREAAADPRATASFRQAIADSRARRARESARERAGWIEYYSDRRMHRQLLDSFREHERAGTLPIEPARLQELYFGLLAAGELTSAQRIQLPAGIGRANRPLLYEDGEPRLALVAHRIVRRDEDFTSRLQLFVLVQRSLRGNFQLRAELQSTTSAVPDTVHHHMASPSSSWDVGELVGIDWPLYKEPGSYRIRIGFEDPVTGRRLCLDGAHTDCWLDLGFHRLDR